MRPRLRNGLFLFTVGCLSSASAATPNATLLEWNEHLLQTIRVTSGIPTGYPGPVSRCIAIVYASVYDAVNSVAPTHEPYHQWLPCPAGTSADAAAASAAHRAMSLAYQFAPSQQAGFDQLYSVQLARIPDGPSKTNGITLGIEAANAIYALRQGDGSEAAKTYVPGVGPGHWVPTWPDQTAAASPHWPGVTPWCMFSGDQFRPTGSCGGFTDMATLLASAEYAAQYDEVKELGAIYSASRTEYETQTAFFWANDRTGTYKPPGHMLHIAQVLADDHDLTLQEQARLFAMTAAAMADAAIASWDTKYSMDIDLWRPITAIWEADSDNNPLTDSDPSWLALSYDPSYGSQGAFTPPFPAWVSGHATFGAATAAVWRRYFGTDRVSFTITSDDAPGVWRTYNTFTDAALENGRSRVFFGVHFQWDADGGYEIGSAVGDFIASNYFRRIGDLNGDGSVNIDDLLLLLNNWGTPAPGSAGVGDVNYDGVVNIDDLLILINAWG
jgi:hypothetical protein